MQVNLSVINEQPDYDEAMWQMLQQDNPADYRPADVEQLCGGAAKARVQPEWQPKITFPRLVEIMAEAD